MLTLLLYVIILGVVAWGVSAIPMPPPFKTIAYVILIIILVVLLFNAFAGGIPSIRRVS